MALNLENIDLGGFGISEEEDKQPELSNQVRANMDEALKVNPDEHANVTKLSQQSDVPEFAVESDPAKVEHELKLDNIDFGQMSARNPNTEKYLTDFNNSVIAQDDIDVLKSIEDIFDFGKTFENIGETISVGFSSQEAGFLLAGADLTPERIQDLMPSHPMMSELERTILSEEYAKNFGITTDEELQEAKKEGVDNLITELRVLQEKRQQLTPEDLNLLEQGVRSGVESLVNMAPSIGLAFLTQGRSLPLTMIGVQTFSSSYGDARAEGLDPNKAGWFATIDAAIEVGTELLPTKTLETIITGKSTGLKKAALKFIVQEMGTEQLATLGQSLNAFAFGLDEEMEKAESIEEMIQIQVRRQAITAIATVVAGGTQITAVTGIRKTIEAVTQDTNKKETKSQVEQQKIDQLNEQAEKSKLRERDKESFKQFVEQADGENNTNVFIDGAQTTLYLQDKTREEIEADPALKLLNEQAREARELGTDVQVPVADFAAEIAGTDHYAELRDSMTMSDETTSPFRQEQQQQETETYIKTLMDEAQENTSEYVEAQEIYTQVRDQLIDTGAVTPANASIMAQIVPAWATAQARRQGKTVQQVYQDSGLVIEGPATGERARLEGEIFEQSTADLQSSLQTEGVDVSLRGEGDVVTLDKIVVPEEQREVGIGTAAMQRVIDWADANGKIVALSPSKDFGGDIKRLRAFYKGLGFVENKGKNKDFEISESMYRPVEQRATLLEQPGVPEDEDIRQRLERDRGERIATQQAVIDEAKDRTDEQAMAEYNRAEQGEEVTFVHRSQDEIDKLDDAKLDVIVEKRTPSAYFGHYLGAADVGNAQRHGNAVTVHKLKLDNPIIITKETFMEVTDGLTHEQAIEKRQQFIEMGHDGILIKDLNWAVVFESETLTEVEEEFEDIETFFAQAPVEPVSTETKAFKEWSGGGEVIEPEDVNDHVFKADTPTVVKVFHGTTHKFDVFDAKRGNLGGQFGAINYFTSSEQDATDNYAGEGPDLTNRIENLKEQLENEYEDFINEHESDSPDEIADDLAIFVNDRFEIDLQAADIPRVDNELDGELDPIALAEYVSRRELSGGEDQIMELFVRVDNPFVIGENAQWIEMVDNEEIQNEAVQQVADNNDIEVSEVEERRDEFEDEIDEARWDIEADTPNKLIEAIQTVSDRNEVDAAELSGQVFELGSEATPETIEQLLRGSEDYMYAEHPETGELVQSQLIAEVIEEMRFDSIILRNAEDRFVNMSMEPGTAHVHVFDSNKTNIKSTENIGTFDPTEESIFRQKPDKEKEARGYYDPANSIIRLTDAADLSTFLHEFAHFMYEMEVNGDTEMLQSINDWYKRNAEDVAKEANGYLGEEFDAEKQLEQRDFAPIVLQAVRDLGFEDSITSDGNIKVFHGSSESNIKNINKTGKFKGFPFFALDRETAEQFSRQAGGKPEVIELIVDPDIVIPTGGYLSARVEGLSLQENNVWSIADELFKQPTDQPTAKEGSITSDDVTTFLDNNTTGDKTKDAAIRRAVHEQFARGFETYLMEGKAPSIELRNAFRAFARWLARIYQYLRGQLDVKVDAEMRQVFDRLLATEEQIQAAEARARVEPMFTDAAMAGMTEEEFVDYQKRQEKVKDVQSETLRDKMIKQLTRQTQKWWKEEKQDIIDEEMESLSEQQVHSTRTRLRDGDIKLDHATVKEMAGEEKEDKLGRKSVVIPPELRNMTAKGQKGVHPDEAAAFFGYKSGSEMLHDLTTAPTIKVQAESNAEARMVDRHGDILTDGTIEQQADEAVQNEERGKLILSELKTLAKGTNAPTIERNTIKDLAETNIGKLSFREIHPGKYRKAEIRAAQESAAMLAKGNKEGAASAKMRQVMNYYLGMAATAAKNDTVKIVDRMARYNKKKVREEIMKAEGGYWDQIVRILNRFEFRKAATLKEVESLNTWMNERNGEAGDALVLTNAVLNESYVTHWKNVPFSDLQGVSDSVKNIEHVARYANKLTRMQEEIDFNKLVDRWVTSMDENVKTRFVSKRADVAEGRKWGRWFMAQMTKIPFMASWLDGGERAGISHQIMVQPFTDAYNAEIKLWEKAGKPVMDAIENRSKADRKRHNQKIYIPEIDDNLYGHQILAVALNTGNQSNLKKMLLGEGWANPEIETDIEFNNYKLQAVLSHMTKDDWLLVQKIWDQMETLYPQLAEVHRRTTGLTPPKVEATPLDVTVDGETIKLKGGYYPVKYDPNRDQRAALNEDKLNAETESMFSNNASIQASVNTGATNERTGYYAPIRLSLDVVPAHFQETIHYITHHDAVREVNRLTRNKQVAQTIKEKLGPEEYAQLRPWLNDIAKDGREAPTKMFWDDMLQRLRFGVTLGTMGFKASTGIIQISGLSNSVAEVGVGNTLQAMRSILGSTTTIKQAWDFAVENSQVLEHRAQTMDREIKNAMKRIEGKRGILAAAQEASMKHIALIQTYMVDLPSWHAAYIKGMQDWGDEARAFQYADWVIENVQGSGATKDMARIMRGQAETGRMFTMFMTFFSSLWNMERDLVKGAKTGRYSTTSVAAKVMFLFTIPVLFEMMMRGELGEPEDEDDRLQRMLTGVAMYPVQSIPFVRDVASATLGEFGYNISPLQSIIEQGTRTLPELITRGFTDDEITKGQIKGATKFIGAVAGIPGMNQAWATGEHLFDVIEEGEEFTTHELLFGPRRE